MKYYLLLESNYCDVLFALFYQSHNTLGMSSLQIKFSCIISPDLFAVWISESDTVLERPYLFTLLLRLHLDISPWGITYLQTRTIEVVSSTV